MSLMLVRWSDVVLNRHLKEKVEPLWSVSGQWPHTAGAYSSSKEYSNKRQGNSLRTVEQDTLDVSHKLLFCGNYQNSNHARLSVESYGRWRRVWITKMT